MLAVRAGMAFDGERMRPGGATVFVDGSRIVGVESASSAIPGGCELVEFPDATVMPGLIDMHVHLCGDSEMGALDRVGGYSDAELDRVVEQGLRRQLSAGVTTVRDLGDRSWSVLGWRDRVGAGAVGFPCPSIIASGPPITTRGGHCWYLGGVTEGEDGLRLAVRERAERGVDVVKIMASGGAMTPGTDVTLCQFSLDEVRTVVDEAHTAGLPVTAHAHGLPAVEQAIEAGVDGIEHCTCLTESGIDMSDRLVDWLAESQIAVCPTLGKTADVVPPPTIAAMWQRFGMTWEARQAQVARMHRGGVRVISGADSGISAGKPHGILPRAIGDLVAGGISTLDALASATSLAAQACGLTDRKGRLAPGYDADLLIIGGDLVSNIDFLDQVVAVVLRGTMVKRSLPTSRSTAPADTG